VRQIFLSHLTETSRQYTRDPPVYKSSYDKSLARQRIGDIFAALKGSLRGASTTDVVLLLCSRGRRDCADPGYRFPFSVSDGIIIAHLVILRRDKRKMIFDPPKNLLTSKSPPPQMWLMLLVIVVIIAFWVGLMTGAHRDRFDYDFTDKDLVTANRVIAEFVHDRKAIRGEAGDPLLKDAQELLKTIKELQGNRDKEASANARNDGQDRP
jgi:hypothetical protein